MDLAAAGKAGEEEAGSVAEAGTGTVAAVLVRAVDGWEQTGLVAGTVMEVTDWAAGMGRVVKGKQAAARRVPMEATIPTGSVSSATRCHKSGASQPLARAASKLHRSLPGEFFRVRRNQPALPGCRYAAA